jgi:bacterioferritin-associated ferredoxin
MDVHIDRCYCFQRRFDDLQAAANASGARSVEELQEYVTFGQRCRLCHPYVRRMLQTGETVFREVLVED